jgi:PilZ domain
VSSTPNSTGSNESRRRSPRYDFVATSVLTDTVSAIRLSGRVTEISRNGCYVDALNALPVGTVLNLQISCDQGTFSTKGSIIYVHPQIGMGVAFVDPPEEQLKTLDSWLAGLAPAKNV